MSNGGASDVARVGFIFFRLLSSWPNRSLRTPRIIECIHCKARYQYDEERFERKPAKKIRCAKCQEVFEIRNPAFAVQAMPESNFDTTAKGKTLPPEPKKKPI